MSATNAIMPKVNDDINSVVTFDELIQQSGVSEADLVVVINPYEVINKDKDKLLGKPFFIRKVRFTADKDSGQAYCVFYAVTQDNQMYVVTDGSTGIFAQLQKICENYDRDHSFLIANGLRKSDYQTPDGQAATTYYLA